MPPGRVEIRADRPLSKRERKKLKKAVIEWFKNHGQPGWEKKLAFDLQSKNIIIVNCDEGSAEGLRRVILSVARASMHDVRWQATESGVRAVAGEHAAEKRHGGDASGGVDGAEGSDRPKAEGLLGVIARKTTDTLDKIRGMNFPERWKAGERFVRELVGASGPFHFHVPKGAVVGGEEITGRGGRHADAIEYREDGTFVAHEVKTYGQHQTDANGKKVDVEVELDAEIEQQVLKDVWLAANVKGYTAFWHFLGAPPSKKLEAFLKQHSIEYKIY